MMRNMRTTLNLDDDVLENARKVADKSGRPFREIINEALRAGLRTVSIPPDAKPYITKPHKMGLRAGRNLDNIQELLAQIEGEEFR
jgi:antitoxin component of RelBE/YafQ-DinJ toxin-antitoxin module